VVPVIGTVLDNIGESGFVVHIARPAPQQKLDSSEPRKWFGGQIHKHRADVVRYGELLLEGRNRRFEGKIC
jgi:hypothetical protein